MAQSTFTISNLQNDFRLPQFDRPSQDPVGLPSKRFTDDHYRRNVLLLAGDQDEEEMDRKLRQEAVALGLQHLSISTDLDGMSSSLSTTTVASRATNGSSVTSRSTAPTSWTSSDFTSRTRNVHHSGHGAVLSPTEFNFSDKEDKQGGSMFRNGIRRMTDFGSRKRKSGNMKPASLSGVRSLQGDAGRIRDRQANGTTVKRDSGVDLHQKEPSLTSSQSSGDWSTRLSTTTPFDLQTVGPPVDHEALRRSMECPGMIALRARQLEERTRFLDYQAALVADIRAEKDAIKAERRKQHDLILEEQRIKNVEAVEDLESRQLDTELKLVKEQEQGKRTVQVRLRHMEAYCQTPTPPHSPTTEATSPLTRTSTSSECPASPILMSMRESLDSSTAMHPPVPQRRVTDKDYYNLATQYRERDAMDSLHNSKINVLRGRQKRQLEKFIQRREQDLEQLQAAQQEELTVIDKTYAKQEAECRAEFYEKRRRLETRWKLQSTIERVNTERSSGLRFESLPEVTADDKGESVTRLSTAVTAKAAA